MVTVSLSSKKVRCFQNFFEHFQSDICFEPILSSTFLKIYSVLDVDGKLLSYQKYITYNPNRACINDNPDGNLEKDLNF